MNVKEETLVILMEECGEVIQECSKILRFGNDIDNLTKELGDLLCMINLTVENLSIEQDELKNAETSKKNKLKTWSNIT